MFGKVQMGFMIRKKKSLCMIVAVVCVAAAIWILFAFVLPGDSGKRGEKALESIEGSKDPSGVPPTAVQEQNTAEPVPVVNSQGETLEERVRVPHGYERQKAKPDSLEAFLREYPLKKAGKPVLLYNGEKKYNQNAHAAVFKLPLEHEDLQQCADSVMRIYAEYFWKSKQKDRISFRFVDGFQADYDKWRKGYRIRVGEAGSAWVPGGGQDDSYEAFKKYMRIVFAYSSTLSMKEESKKIKLSDIRMGDIFLKAGSPGHVVLVVAVCERADGKKAFLLGQGFMPAQEFHLLVNPAHKEDPWYYEEEISYPLETPEYSFGKGSLRRLMY